MKINPAILLLIGCALTTISFAGCSSGDAAVADKAQAETSVDEKVQADESDDSTAATKAANAGPVGEWKIDPGETIEANAALLRKPGMDANAFKASIRGMIMDFLIEPDNIFFCYEKADGIEADYSGTWELKGDKIGLYQKIPDDQPEEDELVGTIDGDRMDLVHKQQGISVKMVLVR